MTKSLHPRNKKWDKIVDVAAIVALVVISVTTKMDPYTAAALISLIAGVNLGQMLTKNGNTPSSVIMSIGYGIFEMAKRLKT